MGIKYFHLNNSFWTLGFIFFLSLSGVSQVGINNVDPQATLDVRGQNHNGPVTANDGILVPRINDLSTSGSENGQLVYLIEGYGNFTKGFHYWNDGKWTPIAKTRSSTSSSSIVEPDAVLAGDAGTIVSFTNSTTSSINDNQVFNVNIPVSGIAGNTTFVSISLRIRHTWDGDLDIFLRSPTGQILELTTDNGSWGEDYYTTEFTDLAPINVTSGSAPFNGSFRPEGTLSSSGTPVSWTGTITSFAGFNDFNPNGQWTLRIGDDAGADTGTFHSATLNIRGAIIPPDWICLGEVSITYFDDSAIIIQSSYSGDPDGPEGLMTAITRSAAPVAIGTTAANLPGAILHYATASPNGTGNVWINTSNLARDEGLIDNTIYYYQLWRKGKIETPVPSNETFALVPVRISE